VERLEDLWLDIKYYIEDHAWTKWALGVGTILVVIGLAFRVFGNTNETIDEGIENKHTQEEQVVDEQTSEGQTTEEQEIIGLSEETVHILANPDEYTEEDVDRAYHESLTTFDNQFVEDNTYKDTELLNGVYIYHEKASEDYREIGKLAEQVNDLGVPIYFYTPQYDQSIAGLANHTEIIEDGEINVYAVIVREGEVDEKISSIEGVTEYLGGVLDANQEE